MINSLGMPSPMMTIHRKAVAFRPKAEKAYKNLGNFPSIRQQQNMS